MAEITSVEELVKRIKLKGTLKALPDFYVLKEIDEYRFKHQKASVLEIFKEVRKRLHQSYGAFQTRRKRKRLLYLEELKLAREENWEKPENEIMKEIRERILRTSVSSGERLDSGYEEIYEKLKKEFGKDLKSVTDLGCGINPVSFKPQDFKNIKIYAYDIDSSDIDFLNKYFKTLNLNGEAHVLDLHDLDKIDKLPKTDICLLYKIIDPLEKRGHEFSEELIKRIKAKYLIVSFATKTISRKKMNYPKRGWFEQMLKRLGKTYKTIKSLNEIYYVVKNE